jgi:hypothetical protein
MRLLILTFIAVLSFQESSYAHPVSYEGGYSLMTQMSSQKSETMIVYSPKWYYGLGAVYEQMKPTPNLQSDVMLTSSQLSWLVNRWNLDDAQGNIYLFGGPGYAHFTDEAVSNFKSGGFYRLGLQADFETRKVYTMFRFIENRLFQSNPNQSNLIFNQLDFRLGYAPYIANYNQLNSWIILNLRTNTEFNKITVIPTLRFYFNNFLWELAQDFDGNSYLNFMTRF